MAADVVGKGVVEIGADVSKLGDDISKKVSGEHGKIGKAFSGLGSMAGKAFKVAAVGAIAGAAAVGAFAKVSIDAASDLAESQSKVEVVFGDSAEAVKKWADTSATAFGQSKQQALEAAGTYGNLFQAFGIQAKPAQEMSQSLVELAADLASFNNTSVPEALQALQSGVSGETEPLKRYGIAINDVRLKQEAMALGLIKSTKDALSPAAKAQASYSLIMKDTALAQGDFARTSDGLANKQRILAAKFDNLKATIGTALMPVMLGLVTVVADKLIPAFETAWDFFKGGFTGEFTNEGEGVLLFMNRLGMALGNVVDWVKGHWPQIRKIVSTVMAAVAQAVGKVFAGLRKVVEAVAGFIVDHWDTIKRVAKNIAEAVREAFEGLIGVVEWVIDHKPVLIGVLTAIGVGVVAMFTSWAISAGAAAAATIAATAPIIAIGAAIAALVAGVIYAYQNWGWFRNTVDAVARFIRDDLVPAFQMIWRFISDHVIPIISTLIEIYIKVLVTQFRIVQTVIMDVVVPALQAVVGFVRDHVIPIFQAIITKIIEVASWVGTKVGEIVGFVTGIAAAIAGPVSTMWDGLTSGITAARNWIAGRIDFIVGLVTGIADRIAGPAAVMWNGLRDGITAVRNWISDRIDFIIKIIGGVVGAVQAVLDKILKAIELAKKLGDIVGYGGGATPNQGFNRAFKEYYGEDLSGKAAGGAVSAFKPYVVGERGWELFVPKTPGTVVPHNISSSWLRNLEVRGHDGDATRPLQVTVQSGYVISERQFMEMVRDGVRSVERERR